MIMNSAKLLSGHALQKKKPWRAWLYTSRAFSAQDSAELQVQIEVDQRKLAADYDPATFDPTEHRSPPTERVFRLVDEVANLTLMEVSQLSAIIMAKIRLRQLPKVAAVRPGALAAAVSAAGAPRPAAAAKPAASAPAKEKTAFELRLEGFDAAAKIKVIKEVRAVTELGLKEAKELVEKLPAVIKRGLTKEEGEALAEKLKAVGAKVVID